MVGREEASEAGGRLRLAGLLPPLLVGAVLRLWNLDGQVVGGDELHLVRAALGRPVGELLTTFGAPDPFPPFAALTRLWLEAGGTITDAWLRAPGILAGLVAIVTLPWLAARFVGRSVAIPFAWLLALSPALVLYSRIARSYMPIVLLGGIAVLAGFRFLADGRRRDATLYAGLGALAVYCHLVATPLVAAPLAFGVGEALVARSAADRRGLFRRLLLAAAGLGLALGAVLLPGWESLVELAAERRQSASLGLGTARGVILLQTGTTSWLAAAAFLGLALAGCGWLWRRRPRLAAFTAWLLAAQLGGVLVLSPVGVETPLIASRYLLPAQPLLLLWAACGLTALARAQARWRLGRPAGLALRAALPALWLAAGPLADRERWQSSFTHHNDFVDWSCPRPEVEPGAVPAFYGRLAAEPGRGAVVELPWQPIWRFARSLPAYQALHGRPVYVASADPVLEAPRVRLARDLPARPEALLASPAAIAIVHHDSAAEEARLTVPACGRWGGGMPPELAARLAAEATRLGRELEASWGPADFSDEQTAVWDLARVRAARSDRDR